MRKKIGQAESRISEQGKDQQAANLERFYNDRKTIKFTQNMDQAKLKAEWKQRNDDRKAAWKEFRVSGFLKKHGVGGDGQSRKHELGKERER